ncbi:GDSL-type esterase/lipase family protein [Arcobacter caeni]|uniref:Lipolytic protein n=1 Tax=Arcobacter caeni TaxID=1912877 RepID=A0A363CZS7_9BACT|nr:GDSL-type esterase/lipase family protein [Arcobacter caeni]PUE64493.1 lipolytic protein [Arcobacter caeni]
MKKKILSGFLFALLLSGCNMKEPKQVQEWKIQDDPYYKHKKSQFEMLAQNDKYKVVMLGDSITDEGEWAELLDSRLIQNRGISGDTTDGVLQRLDSINKSVKQVFIMIGVNDIMRGKSVDEIFTNYQKIVQILKEKDIKVYIQSTLYVGEKRAENFNIKVENLNTKLKQFASHNNLIFIDLNKILSSNKMLKHEFTSDDLHINGKAYVLWADEIKKYI